MDSFRDALDTVERRRKTLVVFADDDSIASELRSQFSTRNVRVTHEPIPPGEVTGFVIIRDEGGEFRGALGIDHFRALLSPEIHPPWELADADSDYAEIFDFLDETVFTSYSRRQMLATAREIEERAWRVGGGTLYAGFQRAEAFASQTAVYRRLADRGSLAVKLFVEDELAVDFQEGVTLVSNSSEEIGSYWMVIFDGGGKGQECGLVAEERTPGRYYGFWTYDPDTVDEIGAYLENEYGAG